MASLPLLAVDAAHVPGIQEIVDNGILSVPPSYIHAAQKHSEAIHNDEIPVIDLSGLLHDQHRRHHTVQEIGRACDEWGFFQVVNHGVPQSVVDAMTAACKAFFGQSAAERNRFRAASIADGPMVYVTTPLADSINDWRDILFVQEIPGKYNGFEDLPDLCKGAFKDYRDGVHKLANSLQQAIFESLGLSSSYIETSVPPLRNLVMGVNYYPPCPDPSLTIGVKPHSDVRSLTVLLQDDVPGLQIRKGDKWVAVKPVANAFVINVADQIQVLSNGIYKSVEHKAVTNSEKPRLSVASFFGPASDSKIAPLSKLVTENRPALYKEFVLADYVKNFYQKGLQDDKGSLDFAKNRCGNGQQSLT